MKQKIIIVLLLLLVIIMGFYLFGKSRALSEYEANVNQITKIEDASRQEAVNEIVEDGMIHINYQTGAIFNGTVSESFNVKNHPNNHYPLVFEIFDKSGNVLYKSKMIQPGYEISKIQLEKELPKGTHKCKMKIGYAQEGNVFSVFPITIQVK